MIRTHLALCAILASTALYAAYGDQGMGYPPPQGQQSTQTMVAPTTPLTATEQAFCNKLMSGNQQLFGLMTHADRSLCMQQSATMSPDAAVSMVSSQKAQRTGQQPVPGSEPGAGYQPSPTNTLPK